MPQASLNAGDSGGGGGSGGGGSGGLYRSRLAAATDEETLLAVGEAICACEAELEMRAPETFAMRCDGPNAPFVSWYRRHRADHRGGVLIATFLAEHADATPLPSGKIRCELTGHELAAQLPALKAHWAGPAYRKLAKRRGTPG